MIDNHGYHEDEIKLILVAIVVALITAPIVLPIMAGQFIAGKIKTVWGRK